MRKRGALIGVMALGAALLAGCQGLQVNAPAPTQPQLVAVDFSGARVCGAPFTNGYGTFTLACDPLPTISATAWRLTPQYLPGPQSPEPYVLNRTVNVTLSTPSLTNLEIAFIPNPRERRIVQQVGNDVRDTQLGNANSLGGRASVVVLSDDGTTKTWRIRMRINPCASKAEFEFVNLSGDGSSRSGPIQFTVLRAEEDTICGGTYGPGGGGTFGTSTSGGGSGTPTAPVPMGACPGGGQPTTFRLCESVVGQPQSIASYTEASACSFDEVKAAYGYLRDSSGQLTTKELAGWRLNQVSGPQACRGTP